MEVAEITKAQIQVAVLYIYIYREREREKHARASRALSFALRSKCDVCLQGTE